TDIISLSEVGFSASDFLVRIIFSTHVTTHSEQMAGSSLPPFATIFIAPSSVAPQNEHVNK
ncbi:MAG: hypothetical protein E6932_16840, partial [Citrobacter freundii]|nr:hypothetical protein [Citrobacter freundii]